MTDAFKERLEDVLADDAPSLLLDERPGTRRPEVERHEVTVVQPLAIPPASTEPRIRPMYDPYTARRRRTPEWLVSYVATLVIGDIAAGVIAASLTVTLIAPASAPGFRLAALAALAWPVLLTVLGAYAEQRMGTSAAEYRRVAIGGVIATALAGYAAQVPELSGLTSLLLLGVPLATALTLVNRALNRWRLHAARRHGFMTKQVVLVGRDVAVLDLAARLRRDPTAGFSVVGACVPSPGSSELDGRGVPVLGDLEGVVRVVDEVGADAIVVASASESAGQYLRTLTWRLEGTNVDVLVGPGLLEVAPNRLVVRPTTSVPLIQIREPEFRGHRRLLKAILDRLGAAVLLVAALPALLTITLAIRLTSPGPALYRHRRIGKRGRPFSMLKFRSMVVDADKLLDELRAGNEGNEVQFKLRSDPRVTRVGRLLRRSSLDELPQLINVLRGDMSFVGPRPHVDAEVDHYGPDMHRRLLVRPGMTGLWQVSGRSDLTWEESVELDVRYVENWSLGLDLAILLRTARAVIRRSGAY